MNQLPGLSASVSSISTNLEIAPFGFDSKYSDNEQRTASYKLRANENLRFLAPSFISDRTYANYVKYELVLKNPVLSNSQYAWADPEDEDELFKTYGTTHFYKQTSDNTYVPLYGSKYEPLTDIPTFKLGYYHKVARGFGESIEPITSLNHFEAPVDSITSLLSKVQTYVPEYERFVYYKLEDGKYKVISTYYPEFSNDLKSGKLYRLKQYVHGLVNVDTNSAKYIPNNYYIYYNNKLQCLSTLASPTCDQEFIYDCLCNYTKYSLLDKNFDYVDDYDTLSDGYVAISSNSSDYLKNYLKNLESSNPSRIVKNSTTTMIKLTSKELTIVKYILDNARMYGTPVYEYSNIINSGDCSEDDRLTGHTNLRFEKVLPYASNIYLKLINNAGTFVGYKLIQVSDASQMLTEKGLTDVLLSAARDICTDLNRNETPNIAKLFSQKSIVVSKTPITWSNKYKDNYIVKYYPTSEEISEPETVAPSAPPDYMVKTCLEKFVGTVSKEATYTAVTSDSMLADNWDIDYTEAYKQENYNGLHTSSPEYLKWKNGSLSLFVRKASFTIDANTEYQLRDGDYIVFFWRDSDEDDAPYTYRKYTHIFDSQTGQKTIIKPNFPIHASSYGNRLFNHDKLNPSGQIPYSAESKSNFQTIFLKMYDEYDLSGSRQIELRKMNSVKLDPSDKKYYYFICPEIELDSENNAEIFSMSFDYAKTWQDQQGVTQYRFQHILQPGEYFIYMNSDQTLYEILGEGTLIEYNTSNPTTVPSINNPHKFVVNAINSNEILYRGADAFRECCRIVEKFEIFNLIEQQVYSFVKDDVVQISLKDSVDYTYEKTNRQSATHYLDYEVAVVDLVLDDKTVIVEPFVDGEYYTFEGRAGNEHFEDYVRVLLKPDDWDDKANWQSGGSCYKKYYKMLYATYLTEDEWGTIASKHDNNWYKRVDPEYPIFNTAQPVLIKGFDVSYSAVSNNTDNSNQLDLTYTSLPSIDVDDESYGWRVTAHLNILCDNQKPQKIEIFSENDQARQSVTIAGNRFPEKFFNEFTDAEKTIVQEHYPKTTFKNSHPFTNAGTDADPVWTPLVQGEDEAYILSSIPLDKIGSVYIDVTYLDLIGERHDAELFTYSLNESCVNADNGWQVVDEGLSLRVAAGESFTTELTGITLDPTYKYLLPISTFDENLTVEICLNDASAKCMCCNSDRFGGKNHVGKHFIEITPDVDTISITVRNKDTINDIYVLFGNLFKYKYREIFGGDIITNTAGENVLEAVPKYQVTTEQLLAKIREIDIPGKFKYTHIPSIDVEIKDPLDPVSMFNENHVYNAFTIARAELDSAKPNDASYDLVNNT